MTTTQLTPAQHAILAYALEHTDGKIDWFPENIKGGARKKVLDGLRAYCAARGIDARDLIGIVRNQRLNLVDLRIDCGDGPGVRPQKGAVLREHETTLTRFSILHQRQRPHDRLLHVKRVLDHALALVALEGAVWRGFSLREMLPALGVLVADVTDGGPADKAGIREGDRLVAINGINLRLNAVDAEDEELQGITQRRLTRELSKHAAGDEVLAVAGERMQRAVRTGDLVAQIGRAHV